VVVSGVDESGVTGRPGEVAAELAARKAQAVADRLAGSSQLLVVGCDSVLELDGETYGKPADVSVARRWWGRMAGREGLLHTGHTVIDVGSGTQAAAVASTVVRFGRPDPAELDAYLATGEPLAVAGSFTLDGIGGVFVDGVTGDPGSVVGISLPLLRNLLAELGVRVQDLWSTPPHQLGSAAPGGRYHDRAQARRR
jgi:septum formation protein